MQTLIKWPGGKSKEFSQIRDMIPSFERYIEPFFGGGAVFFNLKSKKSIINDACKELIDFYRLVKDDDKQKDFKIALYEYVSNWEKIPNYIKLFEGQIASLYKKYKDGAINKEQLQIIIEDIIKKEEKKFNRLFLKKFCLNEKNLLRQIISNLISKISRVKKIEKQRGEMTKKDFHKNIETAFRSEWILYAF